MRIRHALLAIHRPPDPRALRLADISGQLRGTLAALLLPTHQASAALTTLAAHLTPTRT